MGRTNIVIDDKLIEKAIRLSGAKSKREAVTLALRRLVNQASLLQAMQKLQGKLHWQGDLNQWRRNRK